MDANTQTVDPKQAQQGDQPALNAFTAHPGPPVPQSMPEQEGTKEERLAKAQELNKDK